MDKYHPGYFGKVRRGAKCRPEAAGVAGAERCASAGVEWRRMGPSPCARGAAARGQPSSSTRMDCLQQTAAAGCCSSGATSRSLAWMRAAVPGAAGWRKPVAGGKRAQSYRR